MKTKYIGALPLLALAACASHTGVVATGSQSYMIAQQAETGFLGLGNMKAELIQEGAAHCAGKGLDFQLTRTSETQPPYVFGNYPRAEIEFRCIPHGEVRPLPMNLMPKTDP